MQDEIDDILDKQDGQIQRSLDPTMCRHSTSSKCQNCLPLDPFDEAYLAKKEIKHMSFHAYVRKLLGFKRSNLNRYPLENISCKIKENCGKHKPWPLAICDKCRPADVTLNRQKYRHVDNISFENDLLVSNFLDSWRKGGKQRIGFLFGYYEQHTDVPLGIRAVAAAVYEPSQISDGSDSVELAENYQPELAVATELADTLGLRLIGWIFTDLVPDEKQRQLVKYSRNGETYFLSGQECITAGHFQSLYPNRTKYCTDGFFGSKFVTVVVTGDSNQQVQLYGYQVSNQCAALVASNGLVPTLDAPELAYARESTGTHYVPTVNYMAKDEYGNDVRRDGRPLPVEYLIVDVPASRPLQPRYFFYASANRTHFPIENRANEPQSKNTVGRYCRQFSPASPASMLEMVSDLHFLLHLITNSTTKFTLPEIAGLCSAVKAKDPNLLANWMRNTQKWTTFMDSLTGDDDVEIEPDRPNSAHWTCRHCTFVNPATHGDCEMCRLPQA